VEYVRDVSDWPTLQVRPATSTDAPALCDLSVQAIVRSAAGYYTGTQLAAWAARRAVETHRELIARTAVFVATADDELLGFAAVALQPTETLVAGEVDQLYVAPAAGGKGVARRLLTAVEQAARDAGLAQLDTHASWRAVPVFERLGYRQVKLEQVDVDGQVLSRMLMRRDLVERS
jgi:putative acetyltransferase